MSELNHEDQLLMQKYINTMEFPDYQTRKMFSIGLIGLPGSGKSTVSDLIASKTGLFVLASDKVRRFLNENGIDGEIPKQELVAQIIVILTKRLIDNKISYITDADVTLSLNSVQAYYHNLGVELILIKIECPENIILKRINDRLKRKGSHSKATVETYFRRKLEHEEVELPKDIFYTVDTSCNLDGQINELIDKLNFEGYLY